jgi:hypothetical protein
VQQVPWVVVPKMMAMVIPGIFQGVEVVEREMQIIIMIIEAVMELMGW